jgi:drug/metabolite transporter (DMT)-like permease
MDCFKEGVRHMPPLQLAELDNLLRYLRFLFLYKKEVAWKTVENNHHILNFALSNGLSTWGVKFISSGLGAILNAVFPLWIVIITFQGRKLARLAILGLIISFSGVCYFL